MASEPNTLTKNSEAIGAIPVPDGVSAEAWAAIGAVRVRNKWQIPERDGFGTVIGTAIRPAKGKIRMVRDSKRGLLYAAPFDSSAGLIAFEPILITEGATDAAAAITLGFDAVGRASVSVGREHLAELLKGRHVCIVSDNDASGVGSKGASDLAHDLFEPCESVRIINPPPQHKDLRLWVIAGCTKADVIAKIEAAAPCDAGNSIQPSLGKGRGRFELNAVRITDIEASATVPWIWTPFLARGTITLLTGFWKCGKSTLISYLLRDLEFGGGLVKPPAPVRTLVISEEGASIWCKRRDEIGLGDCVFIASRPLKSRADSRTWNLLVEQVIAEVQKHGIELVIFDTISAFWPVKDENDAADMLAALLPLNQIIELGVAVLLVHHPRKGEASHGQASRGSGALPGFVDTLVEFRPFSSSDHADRRRKLVTASRLHESVELIVEYTDEGYVSRGLQVEVDQNDLFERLAQLLPSEAPGIGFTELLERWTGANKPGLTKLKALMSTGTDRELWVREGRGAKGSPHTFWKRDSNQSPSSLSTTESNPTAPDELDASTPAAQSNPPPEGTQAPGGLGEEARP